MKYDLFATIAQSEYEYFNIPAGFVGADICANICNIFIFLYVRLDESEYIFNMGHMVDRPFSNHKRGLKHLLLIHAKICYGPAST